MNKPTDIQVKKFWEGYGFKWDTKIGHWDYPDGSPFSQLPPIGLNNLFKWAVPKLVEITDKFRASATIGRAIVKAILDSKDPAIALFWALDKVRAKETTDYSWEAQGLDPSWGVPQ